MLTFVPARVRASTDGFTPSLVGLGLLVAAYVLYRFLPRLDLFIGEKVLKRPNLPAKAMRIVGGPVFVGAIGTVCLVAGVVRMVS